MRALVSGIQIEFSGLGPNDGGIALTHTTILRWIQRFVPEFEKRWSQYSRPVGRSWCCDETYIKVKGRWAYLYRAVDKQGRTVDLLLRSSADNQFWRIAEWGSEAHTFGRNGSNLALISDLL